MSNNAHDLSNRLLNALDNNYNVVDMHTVNEIISILEKINITKELLETTRLGKHVNELRRKSTDPELARRAKVLVKRWRDLVIPHRVETASVPIRSPAPRRLAGTPLTSPALSRHVVSPAVSSPRPPSRPAWGGYESDSQDVILVDDEPCPAALPAPVPAPSPAPTASREHASGEHGNAPKRPASPPSLHEDKKTKRDKKLKKRRGHSRAGSGSEPPAEPPGSGGRPWAALNGSAERSERGPGRPRNGCRNRAVDPYTALVNKIPAAGGKKVKTTLELLQQIQSRGLQQAAADDDDVVLVEDVCPIKPESPVRNGSAEPIVITPEPEPLPPLEDERLRPDCCCGEDEEDPQCPAARVTEIRPFHVVALHNAFLPGVNGTRAPPHPHQFAVRRVNDPDQPGLFTSVVPLYKYSDYADDYCVKNMARVPLCPHLPWTEFAPDPPELPDPPSPPPIRPYPVNDVKVEPAETQSEISQDSVVSSEVKTEYKCKIEPEMVNLPHFEPTDRLKAPILTDQDAKDFGLEIKPQPVVVPLLEVVTEFKKEQEDHRTVEKTKDDTECSFINKVNLDGRTLYALCEKALESVPYNYCQTSSAPTVTLPEDVDEGPKVLESALDEVAADRDVDTLGRPPRPTNFTEWHECAKLGSLIALPYVVID